MPISINLFYNHLKEDNMSIGSMSRYLLRNCVAEIRSLMSGGVQIVPLLECRLPMGASSLCAWLQGGICGSKVENFDHRRVSKLNLFDLRTDKRERPSQQIQFQSLHFQGHVYARTTTPTQFSPNSGLLAEAETKTERRGK